VPIEILASEVINKNIWYPTILGVLVVVFAVLLFIGSTYLLLATNLGARLGFLIAFTGLMGFMVVLSSLWILTSSPLNTLKGRLPSWEALEVVSDPADAKTEAVRAIEKNGVKVDTIEQANIKASADANLIAVQALPNQAEISQQAFARFQSVTEYQVINIYEIGGGSPNPFNFEATHTPKYAVIEFCKVAQPEVPFGTAPPPPECAPASDKDGFLVLQRDLGSLRVPPFVAFISSLLLFGLGLLLLHWREKDERAAKQRETPPTEEKTPESASA